MGGDGQAAGFVDDLIGRENVRGSAHGGRAVIQLIRGDPQAQEQVLNLANVLLLGKDPQDMEAKRRRKLKSGEHKDLIQQPAVFVQALLLRVCQAIQFLEQFKLFDFLLHPAIAGDGVMIREGDDFQTPLFTPMQDIQEAHIRLLVIAGCRRVQMQIHDAPFSRRPFPTSPCHV